MSEIPLEGAGKGSATRKNFDFKKYQDNYPKSMGKKSKTPKVKEKK